MQPVPSMGCILAVYLVAGLQRMEHVFCRGVGLGGGVFSHVQRGTHQCVGELPRPEKTERR